MDTRFEQVLDGVKSVRDEHDERRQNSEERAEIRVLSSERQQNVAPLAGV